MKDDWVAGLVGGGGKVVYYSTVGVFCCGFNVYFWGGNEVGGCASIGGRESVELIRDSVNGGAVDVLGIGLEGHYK